MFYCPKNIIRSNFFVHIIVKRKMNLNEKLKGLNDFKNVCDTPNNPLSDTIEPDLNNLGDVCTSAVSKDFKLSKEERNNLAKERRRVRKQERKRKTDTKLDVNNSFDKTSYYFENGLRKVHPYYHTHRANTKRRWLGCSLLDMVKQEFGFLHSPSFLYQIKAGHLRVNDKVVEPDYKLKDNDTITHLIHKHELPVTDEPIVIVHEDDNLLVVNKPGSIPIHPCGRYNFNSLTHILAKSYGKTNLRSVHRIDRMTSGLMIFGKNYDTTVRLTTEIQSRQVEKEYICRVEGVFPGPDKVECHAPVGTLTRKVGTQLVVEPPEGKEAFTTFLSVASAPDGSSSVVRCWPHTGRTHQIRVHLQYLGYPIINDPLYNSDVWGPEKGREGRFHKTKEQLIEDLLSKHEKEAFVLKNPSPEHETDSKRVRLDDDSSELARSSADDSLPHCPECDAIYEDPTPASLSLCLHAHRYKGSDWEFTSPWPVWANYNNDD